MKYTLLLLTVLLSVSSPAQTSTTKLPEYFQLATGISKHGTGDMSGYAIAIDYKRYLRQRTSISIGLATTIHDGVSLLLYTDPNNNPVDGSFRYGSSGIQLSARAGYSFVRSKRHTLEIQIGALVRYQTSSTYDERSTFFPALTGYPVPLSYLVHLEKQQIVSLGGIGAFQYQYHFASGDHIGFRSSLQTDTNGDVISMVSLLFGYRLRHEKK
jgi:hypothetical protein